MVGTMSPTLETLTTSFQSKWAKFTGLAYRHFTPPTFYEQLQPRLRPGGIVCQFLPIEFFGQAEFRTLIATFCNSFSHSMLWYNTTELLLIGSTDQAIRFDPQHYSADARQSPATKARARLCILGWARQLFFHDLRGSRLGSSAVPSN